jgi:2-(1,2-epoxy-1,2-dihydrophenyl)acetyl-CoA isomerase
MSYQHILYQEADGIATLTLNRPDALNALHADMIDEMIDAVARLADTRTARVLVLTGAGRAFSAGADLTPPPGGSSSNNAIHETHYNRLLTRLVELTCPVIASVNGPAVGAGCLLALLSDFVIADRASYFLQAFVNIGLVPDFGATWLLPRLIGPARATQMLMLGEKLPAERAEEWGLIYRAVDGTDLAAQTRSLAQRLAAGPTLAYGLIRHGIRYGLEHSLMDTVALERRNQLLASRSGDFREGVEAFRNKRKPSFQGE